MEAAVLTDRFPRTQVLPSQDMPTYQVAGEDLLETVRFLRDAQGFDEGKGQTTICKKNDRQCRLR